uniref:Uncharacterized protein n=1 Tax=Pseudo-nitzschia australis TaxID=44445 RepID=A0A7S4ALH2_9STRA|mmetsp:Transcript_24431/g.53503  ORF Transcript_24431/g.53503 Transcript_24431/m.53503 type:complete len:393 (-) Transcript_24431:55-1233(-)
MVVENTEELNESSSSTMNDTFLLDFVGAVTKNLVTPALNSKIQSDISSDDANPQPINSLQALRNDDESSSLPSSSQLDQRYSGFTDTTSFSDCITSSTSSNKDGNFAIVDSVLSPKRQSVVSSITSLTSSTPTPSSSKSQRQKQNRQRDRKKSRSRAVKGATNLAKETTLLRHRLDHVMNIFQDTVVSAAQSQTTKLASLHTANKQLLSEIRELEIETFKQASELDDSDDLMVQMEERRLSLKKEVSVLKEKCYSLAKEVLYWKKSLEAYEQTEKAKLVIENNELESENKSLRSKLDDKESTIRQLGIELFKAKMKLMNDKENKNNNTIDGDVKIQNSDYGARKSSTFGQKVVVADLTPGKSSESSAKTPKRKHRKSSRLVSLRGHSKKSQF